MARRRIILALAACFSLAAFAVQTLSQTRSSNPKPLDLKRLQKMTEEQRKRQVQRRLQELKRQDELRHQEHRRKTAEIQREKAQKRKQQRLQREQRQQELKKEEEEAGGIACWFAKIALGETEEQWNLIQPKLKKVIDLWYQANSTVGAGVSGGSTDSRTEPSLPKLQWERPWKYKPLFELTEAQRLARQLRTLLEKEDTPPEVFRRKIAALREARSKEAEIQKQLAEARRELREILTTRQEAILVLLGWL